MERTRNGMHIFVILIDDESFKSYSGIRHGSLESGDAFLVHGKTAIVLGTGVTRSEAKINGKLYYNRVAKIHGDDQCDFQTQNPHEMEVQQVGSGTHRHHESDSDDERKCKRVKH